MRWDRTFAINPWEAPALVPVPGEWPDVRRVLLWFAEDEAGLDGLLNWIAFKVQHPGSRPGTAILLQGLPGSGKNVLDRILTHMLGPSNCVQTRGRRASTGWNVGTLLGNLPDRKRITLHQRPG
jgi:hypothetical protein